MILEIVFPSPSYVHFLQYIILLLTRISFALTRKIILVKILEEHGLWDNQENCVSNIETMGLTNMSTMGLTFKVWD